MFWRKPGKPLPERDEGAPRSVRDEEERSSETVERANRRRASHPETPPELVVPRDGPRARSRR